jgi:signal transduction histidine kinase
MPECKIQRRLDRRALSRIFGNIIDNAIKYSDGSLEITLSEAGEIDFTNSASQLDEIQVGRLFDRFYTVEAAKKSTGLGLSIAKALTEQMNGTISAHYLGGKLNIHIVFAK